MSTPFHEACARRDRALNLTPGTCIQTRPPRELEIEADEEESNRRWIANETPVSLAVHTDHRGPLPVPPFPRIETAELARAVFGVLSARAGTPSSWPETWLGPAWR